MYQIDETVKSVRAEKQTKLLQLLPSPIDFKFDFLLQHPSKQLTTKLMKKKRKRIRRGSLIAASDGFAITDQNGSFAFYLASSGGKMLFQSYSPMLCEPDSIHFDRTEILGLLEIVTTLVKIVNAAKNLDKYL